MGNTALYRALLDAGADEQLALEAADDSEIVTKPVLTSVLRAELSELKAELIKWMVTLNVMTASVVIAILKLT